MHRLVLTGTIAITALFLLSGIFFVATLASSEHLPPSTTSAGDSGTKTYSIETPASPLISVPYLIFDATTGTPLASHRESEVHPIASITKLFAAEAVLDTFDLTQEVIITADDTAHVGRAGKLIPGDVYTTRQLLFPLLLESSNDAAAALTRAGAGTLVQEMNSIASRLSLLSTHFTDPSGLESANTSTADDVALYLRHLSTSAPHLLDITSLKQFVGEETTWINNNPGYSKNFIGGKHGYTDDAGSTIAALYITTISGEERTIGYIILGSNNLRQDLTILQSFVDTAVRFK